MTIELRFIMDTLIIISQDPVSNEAGNNGLLRLNMTSLVKTHPYTHDLTLKLFLCRSYKQKSHYRHPHPQTPQSHQ